jgi:Family of unknown function (DUF6491)
MLSARRNYAVLMLALLAASGCAVRRSTENTNSSLPGRDDCIWDLYIERWDVVDPSTLLVYTADKKYYLVKLAQPVSDLSNRESAGFYASNHDDRVCGTGSDMLVRASDSLRDPLIAIRVLKARQARQFEKTPERVPGGRTARRPATTPAASSPGNTTSADSAPTNATPADNAPANTAPANTAPAQTTTADH